MISKYNKFKEDLLLENLVNESFLYFSPNLRNIIIKVGGEISDELINSERTDIKPDITFVDVDKEGYLSFTTMKNAIKTLVKKYQFVDPEKWENQAFSQHDVDSIFNDSGEDNNNVYAKSRNSVKIGKFINKVLTKKHKDKDIEEFVNKFKSKIENSGEKFEIVEGDDIAFWYKSKNNSSSGGTLGNSCMSSMSDNTFNIYSKNPEVCKMLILKDDDKILGRALIWKLDTIKVGGIEVNGIEYFMDRQYTIKDSDVQKFRNYAKEQKNWVSKANNNHYSFEAILLHQQGDDVRNSQMTVQLKKSENNEDEEYDYDRYPYVDTFRRYDPRTGILHNDESDGDGDNEGCYLLESTSGGYKKIQSGHWSGYYDCNIPEDEAIYSDVYGDWLYIEESVRVYRGSRIGVYHQNDDYIVYDEKLDEYIHLDDCVYSDAYEHYIYDETAVMTIVYIPEDGNIDSDGDWYYEDDDDLVKIDKESTWYKGVSELSRNWSEFDYVVSEKHRYQRGTWVKDYIMVKNYLDESIPEVFSIELYKIIPTSDSISVGVTHLSKIDASVLKYKIDEEDTILTDQFQYHEDLKENLTMLYTRLVGELDYVFNRVKKKAQLRLKFDEEDDSKYQDELREKRKKLIKRIDQIEDGKFIEGFEIPNLDS